MGSSSCATSPASATSTVSAAAAVSLATSTALERRDFLGGRPRRALGLGVTGEGGSGAALLLPNEDRVGDRE